MFFRRLSVIGGCVPLYAASLYNVAVQMPETARTGTDFRQSPSSEQQPPASSSPPDVQNVPDVWSLLEQARSTIYALKRGEHAPLGCIAEIDATLAQRDRFVLVPAELTTEMANVYKDWHRREKDYLDVTIYRAMLAAAPKPEEKR